MNHDKEQGGWTPATFQVQRAWMLWSILVNRKLRLLLPTIIVFVDMAHFFDTILVENVLKGMIKNKISYLLVNAAMDMNTNITAQVMTASEISESTELKTGLRQGGRFSTTGAKLAFQELNEPVRVNKGVLMGANEAHITDIELADDELLLGGNIAEIQKMMH